MKKIDKYVKELESSIKTVDKAVKDGAYLMKYEKFDLEFKRYLYNGTNGYRHITNKELKLPYLYAKYLRCIFNLRAAGYSNKAVDVTVKTLVKDAKSFGLASRNIKVVVSDFNGVLTIELLKSKESVHKFYIKDIADLTASLMCLVSYLGSDLIKDKETKEFMTDYLVKVFKDIMSGTKPIPYVYKGRQKSLMNYFIDANASNSPGEKVVEFKIG